METTKLIKLKIETKAGTKTLVYKPIQPQAEHQVCDYCPYERICSHIPDPLHLDDPKRRYIDFCTEINENTVTSEVKITPELSFSIIPVEHTIEDNLEDLFDANQCLIQSNSLVRVKDVIKDVCAGWCDSYDENYSNCKSCNASCILSELFKNKNIDKLNLEAEEAKKQLLSDLKEKEA